MIPAPVMAASFQAHYDLVTIQQGHGWLATATKCVHDGEALFRCTSHLTDFKSGKTFCISFKLSTDGRAWAPRPTTCPTVA